MPLVLVHNDVVANPAHQWDDIEGVHYHYPSKYKRKINTGDRFVYYRGVHRPNGKRGPAQYVGSGRIGEIWADSDRKNAWYCAVVDYSRFPVPVDAKINGVNREDIPSNLWRDGVRTMEQSVYDAIIAEGRSPGDEPKRSASPLEVPLRSSNDLILPPLLARHQKAKSGYRRSQRSKAVGDWAELAALRFIRNEMAGSSNWVHRASQGETPGWDIDYLDHSGMLQRVEVKGTIAAAFSSVELTANEMAAAKTHGRAYWLCLVANCETASAKIQFIQDPFSKLAAGEWSARPAVYSIRFAGSDPAGGSKD